MIITQDHGKHISQNAGYARFMAKYRLLKHKLTTNEKILDRFLRDSTKKSLFENCLYLINNANITYDSAHVNIITFRLGNDDNLANIITYGTGKILGSSILRDLFKPD